MKKESLYNLSISYEMFLGIGANQCAEFRLLYIRKENKPRTKRPHFREGWKLRKLWINQWTFKSEYMHLMSVGFRKCFIYHPRYTECKSVQFITMPANNFMPQRRSVIQLIALKQKHSRIFARTSTTKSYKNRKR